MAKTLVHMAFQVNDPGVFAWRRRQSSDKAGPAGSLSMRLPGRTSLNVAFQ